MRNRCWSSQSQSWDRWAWALERLRQQSTDVNVTVTKAIAD